MSNLIHYRVEGSLALIGLDRPPVNALSQRLRAALIDACERAVADAGVQAIVLYGKSGLFSAGADVAEPGAGSSLAEPDGADALVRLTRIGKPLIAAIGNVALGAGLELALACGYRIGEPDTCVGWPDIDLGLLPGAVGTQRLPRLIGLESTLNLMLSGKQVDAENARLLGMLDRVATCGGQLLDEACAYAHELISRCAPAQPPEAWPEPAAGLPDDFLALYRAEHEPRWNGRLAPRLVLAAVEAACKLPLAEGLVGGRALFKAAEASAQPAELRHVSPGSGYRWGHERDQA